VIGHLLAFRNFERAAQHRAPDLRWEMRHDVLKPGRDDGRLATKQPFKSAHCWIEYRVMLLEERNELAHLGFIGREFARVLGDLDKTVAIARLFDFGKQEIQFDEIEMLNFISAALNELPRRHKGRHVTADAQPMRMRAIGDDWNQLGFDR